MAMGLDIPPPELADSWGEYRALLDRETAALENRWMPLWWTAGTILFGAGLLCCTFAVQTKDWLMWVGMLAPLAAAGVLAARAVAHADRVAARRAELRQLEYAWEIHRSRDAATW
jgi:peptidoglycan/LPS O-acetylase OafA/YrhL